MKKSFFGVFVFLLLTCALFFYKFFLYGQIPFPGDLLIAEYNPWKTYSYLGYTEGSYPNKAQYFDVLRQLYPWKTFVIHQLKNMQIPFWNQYNFSGAPLLANFQSAVFYPFNLFYFFLEQKIAWGFLIFLQTFLAAYFTYLYARKISLGIYSSLFSAVSFAFCSFLTVWLEYGTIDHVILWLPLILLAIEHLLVKKSKRWSVVLVSSLVFSAFAGHIQIFGYIVIFSLVYLLYRAKGKLLFFLSLFGFSFLISGIQLIPGLELISSSARSAHTVDFFIDKILIQPYQLVMFFVPDFFGNPATRNYWPSDTYVGKVTSIGVVPLFFIGLSLFGMLKNSLLKFFWTSSLVVLLLATRNPISEILYGLGNSFLLSSSPTLLIFLLCFSMSMIAGFGMEKYLSEKLDNKKYLKISISLIFLFLFLWIVVMFLPHLFGQSSNVITAKRNLILPTVLLFATFIFVYIGIVYKQFRIGIIILLILFQTTDLFRSFQKFNPFIPTDIVFPNTSILTFIKNNAGINRFWGYGSASVEANFATNYMIFSPDGYDPLYPRIYGEFIQSAKEGRLARSFTMQNRSDAVLVSGFGENDLMANDKRLKVLDTLGVKYILDRFENKSTEKTFPSSRFKLLYQDNNWKVFENLKAAPRIFLTSDYKVVRTKEEFEKTFFAKEFDLRKTVLLEEKLPFSLSPSVSSQPKLVTYTPNKIEIDTKASGNSLLFLSDTYYPGWKATIDAVNTKIYKADYAFRAVAVPKGEHHVVFEYKPESFTIGSRVTGVGFVLFALFLIFFL